MSFWDARPAHDEIYEYPLHRWQDVAASRLKRKDFILAARDLAAIYWRYMRGGANPQIVTPVIQRPAPSHQHR